MPLLEKQIGMQCHQRKNLNTNYIFTIIKYKKEIQKVKKFCEKNVKL